MAHLEIHRVADSYVPRFRDTFLTSVGQLRSQVTAEMVAEDMRAPDNPAGLFALLDSMQIAKGDVEQKLYAEIALNGASVAIGEEELLEMLTLDSPKMQQAAHEMAGTMIEGVTSESKQAIRQIIGDAFAEGSPPAQAQKVIRQVFGLTKRDAIAVNRFAEAQANTATTPRLLHLADKRVERYSAKLLRRRALSIARTETVTASNRGLVMGWEQMADEGLIDRSRTQQRWLTVGDDRTCPRCAPMNGKTVSLGGTYTETERGVLPSERVPVAGETTETPALHSNCRCSLVLDFT